MNLFIVKKIFSRFFHCLRHKFIRIFLIVNFQQYKNTPVTISEKIAESISDTPKYENKKYPAIKIKSGSIYTKNAALITRVSRISIKTLSPHFAPAVFLTESMRSVGTQPPLQEAQFSPHADFFKIFTFAVFFSVSVIIPVSLIKSNHLKKQGLPFQAAIPKIIILLSFLLQLLPSAINFSISTGASSSNTGAAGAGASSFSSVTSGSIKALMLKEIFWFPSLHR